MHIYYKQEMWPIGVRDVYCDLLADTIIVVNFVHPGIVTEVVLLVVVLELSS